MVIEQLPGPLAVVLVAMTPIFELRGAIPVGVGVFHMPIWQAAVLSIIGNMVPAFIVLYGWDAVISLAEKRLPSFHRFMDRYHHSLHMKWASSIDKHGPWALALFVAVPLPLTGVWSGALVAWIFGLHRRPAIAAIFVGVCIAAALVSLVPFLFMRIFPNGL